MAKIMGKYGRIEAARFSKSGGLSCAIVVLRCHKLADDELETNFRLMDE
jgi:hypothetical protein